MHAWLDCLQRRNQLVTYLVPLAAALEAPKSKIGSDEGVMVTYLEPFLWEAWMRGLGSVEPARYYKETAHHPPNADRTNGIRSQNGASLIQYVRSTFSICDGRRNVQQTVLVGDGLCFVESRIKRVNACLTAILLVRYCRGNRGLRYMHTHYARFVYVVCAFSAFNDTRRLPYKQTNKHTHSERATKSITTILPKY